MELAVHAPMELNFLSKNELAVKGNSDVGYLFPIDPGESVSDGLDPTYLEEILGFKVTVRTLTYIQRRLEEIYIAGKAHKILQRVFTEDRILEFKAIFRETLNLMPFANEKERNIDVINAVNFAIFDELQGKRVAQEGLRSVFEMEKRAFKVLASLYEGDLFFDALDFSYYSDEVNSPLLG